MEVRRLQAGEGALLRELRLRALEDAPYAFSSWLAREEGYAPEAWDERAAQSGAAETGAVFVAAREGRCVGMAGGYLPAEQPGTARLWGMWVAPEERGRGLGRELAESVAEWARGRGARRLELSVSEGEPSLPAARLYRLLGFTETGGSEMLEWDRSLTAAVMSRSL